jgi:hypothetical protein
VTAIRVRGAFRMTAKGTTDGGSVDAPPTCSPRQVTPEKPMQTRQSAKADFVSLLQRIHSPAIPGAQILFFDNPPTLPYTPRPGSRTVNVLPAPGVLRAVIVPPCCSAIIRAMARPRPVPPLRSRAASAR